MKFITKHGMRLEVRVTEPISSQPGRILDHHQLKNHDRNFIMVKLPFKSRWKVRTFCV